ncbi:MAG: hypothetical protein M1825_006089 [Sarcosagium campestre]|nr:MAG: hypothetical protein M1825_006089 [Sarcosagium campestre]
MQCVGFQIESKFLSETYRNAVSQMLASQTLKDGYLVQAMLIFTITLHAQDHQQAARQMLNSAIQIAMELGMNRMNFASDNSAGSQFLEESWRRTWWELYVLDGMLAALHQQSSFRLASMESSVLLPCEDFDYSSADTIPEACTVAQFRNRVFGNDTLFGSSFAYRIEAMRILGTILALNRSIYVRDGKEFEAIEASLSSWFVCLPPSKRQVLTYDGKVDEMLFQAQMIINACTIYLHQPRSSLSSPWTQESVFCTRQLSSTRVSTAHHVHCTKTMQAANKLLDLISLPGPLSDHTPFFICTIALGAMVNLSAFSLLPDSNSARPDVVREHVILATGALSLLGETWAVAGSIVKEVKSIARRAFRAEPAGSNSSSWTFDDDDIRSVMDQSPDDFGWQNHVGSDRPEI